jgi:hypothetical protein
MANWPDSKAPRHDVDDSIPRVVPGALLHSQHHTPDLPHRDQHATQGQEPDIIAYNLSWARLVRTAARVVAADSGAAITSGDGAITASGMQVRSVPRPQDCAGSPGSPPILGLREPAACCAHQRNGCHGEQGASMRWPAAGSELPRCYWPGASAAIPGQWPGRSRGGRTGSGVGQHHRGRGPVRGGQVRESELSSCAGTVIVYVSA